MRPSGAWGPQSLGTECFTGSHPLAAAQGPDPCPLQTAVVGGTRPALRPRPRAFLTVRKATLASRCSLGLPRDLCHYPSPKSSSRNAWQGRRPLSVCCPCAVSWPQVRAAWLRQGPYCTLRSPVPRVRLERVLVPGQSGHRPSRGRRLLRGLPLHPRSCQALCPVGAGRRSDSEGPGPGAPVPRTAPRHGPGGPPLGGWDRLRGLGLAN